MKNRGTAVLSDPTHTSTFFRKTSISCSLQLTDSMLPIAIFPIMLPSFPFFPRASVLYQTSVHGCSLFAAVLVPVFLTFVPCADAIVFLSTSLTFFSNCLHSHMDSMLVSIMMTPWTLYGERHLTISNSMRTVLFLSAYLMVTHSIMGSSIRLFRGIARKVSSSVKPDLSSS
ncbi:hypothetical protein Tco_0312204 [Tanacetum coccineum]